MGSLAERWQSGLLRTPGKRVLLKATESSNLSLSATTRGISHFSNFMAFPDYLYEKLRRVLLSAISFSEIGSSYNPLQEKWLYSIWSHQRIKGNALHTLTGEPLFILHPGFRSLEAGPDFRNALIRIGNNPPQQCDIEIDLGPSGWKQHSHEGNPAYQNVGLQVIWNLPEHFIPPVGRPILNLKEFLDAPQKELLEWCLSDDAQSIPESLMGKCCEYFSQLSENDLDRLLQQAAQVRLKSKSLEIAATARNYGWEKALYIHLLRGLGYKQNSWPMQRLAEVFPKNSHSLLEAQALLLGIADMIPKKLSNKDDSQNEYALELWDIWWHHQASLTECILPESIWKLSSTRPVNHPQRRIALAAHWLTDPHFIDDLESWAVLDCTTKDAQSALFDLLKPKQGDPFWEHHYTLRSKRFEKTLPLIGEERVSDLFVNVIAPWFWARTDRVHDPLASKQILNRYLSWPTSGKNARIELALKRFYGATPAPKFKYAYQQQAVLQITSDFCAKTDPCCHHCPLPESLRQCLHSAV